MGSSISDTKSAVSCQEAQRELKASAAVQKQGKKTKQKSLAKCVWAWWSDGLGLFQWNEKLPFKGFY